MTRAGWAKSPHNPVLGGALGTCFDICVLRDHATWRMWFSWRPRKSLALTESDDGVHWSEPKIVLGPRAETGWEDDLNRPVVVLRDGIYHLWYTGQAKGRSAIGYAVSADGITWTHRADQPVLKPEAPWEKVAVMCPHVLWDGGRWRMWYSGGDQYEPDALGHAESTDGLHWTRAAGNPIFRPDPAAAWEAHKVTACQVVPYHGGYAMFYIGFRDVDHATIGAAWSADGLSGWKRHPENPWIAPDPDTWDHDACYKPSAVLHAGQWWLWYNGRHGPVEQIGLATHPGEDLGL